MVKTTLIFFVFVILMIISKFSFADPNIDQWLETEKTYKDLVNEGYEVKSYSISNIQLDNGMLILFVTVLQKDEDLFECQEYQTMDQNLDTLDMNLICKQLVQPYQRGIGT
tara:strand:- start:72 stop:404 length:333 start_codon:yes stop_codon:yes gene_type:complete